jgi:hypothetical protein
VGISAIMPWPAERRSLCWPVDGTQLARLRRATWFARPVAVAIGRSVFVCRRGIKVCQSVPQSKTKKEEAKCGFRWFGFQRWWSLDLVS